MKEIEILMPYILNIFYELHVWFLFLHNIYETKSYTA